MIRCLTGRGAGCERRRRKDSHIGISVGDKALTWEQRFWRRVIKTDGDCWTWTGGIGGTPTHPYGVYTSPVTGRRGAHVVSFEIANGPLGTGLVIDHVCLNTMCVNPSHLDAVTPKENRRRQSSRKTHCKRGHELAGPNLYEHRGRRYCRQCRANQDRRRRVA